MSAFDVVLQRLDAFGVRMHAADRGRSRCPACSSTNRSMLSFGVGREGQVLLKCFGGCDIEAVVDALGLEMQDLFPPKGSTAAPMQRRRLLPAGQALDLLGDEMLVTLCSAETLANGGTLTAHDRDRLLTAAARVAMLQAEVRA